MSDYVIGDIQGHYDGLLRLLAKIKFNPSHDRLYFVGDLVNRGPASLKTLQFLANLSDVTKVCLGNHDLYLLQHLYSKQPQGPKEELSTILNAPERHKLGAWLRQQHFLIPEPSAYIVHAGVAPTWTEEQASSYALELEAVLRNDEHFFLWMNSYFTPRPKVWDSSLTGLPRWQLLADIFTRMRFTSADGHLDFSSHEGLQQTPPNCYPWYACPKRETWSRPIIFGHWASLLGKTGFNHFQNIDTGFHWGGTLTALNLDNFKRYSTF